MDPENFDTIQTVGAHTVHTQTTRRSLGLSQFFGSVAVGLMLSFLLLVLWA